MLKSMSALLAPCLIGCHLRFLYGKDDWNVFADLFSPSQNLFHYKQDFFFFFLFCHMAKKQKNWT